jgi:predicted nucleotidyltransferase
MSGDESVLSVVESLEEMGIAYVLVGTFASNIYGVDRATLHAILVADLEGTAPGELFRRLRPAIRFEPQMGFETVTMTRKYVAEVTGTAFKIELFHLSEDLHDRARFERRRAIEFGGSRVFILSAEDVIITKLRWARSKDRDDVRVVIAVHEGRIDWDYVHSWTEQHGTTGLLEGIRRSIPPID